MMRIGVLLALTAFSMCCAQNSTNEELKCDMFMPYYQTKSEKDCKHYWRCQKGVLTEKKCPWLQRFNPTTGKCQLWRSNINCSAEAAPLPDAWPRFDCTDRPDFKLNSPWGCKYFIQCSGGELSAGSCPWYYPKFQVSTEECWSIGRNVCKYTSYTLNDEDTTEDSTTVAAPGGGREYTTSTTRGTTEPLVQNSE